MRLAAGAGIDARAGNLRLYAADPLELADNECNIYQRG